MSTRSAAAVAELRAAARALRASGGPVQTALGALTEAQANYWTQWFPSEPSTVDRAWVTLARAVNNPPDAGTGPRQQDQPQPEQEKMR